MNNGTIDPQVLAKCLAMTPQQLQNELQELATTRVFTRDTFQRARAAMSAAASELDVAAQYDLALCKITRNLDEPRSSKQAQLALDAVVVGPDRVTLGDGHE